MHHFRAARRRAAIERRNLEVGELRAALQRLKNEPVVVEREVFVGVEKEVVVEKVVEVKVPAEKIVEIQIEKTVEVPVEKGSQKETTAEKLEDEVAATGGGFTEADMSAAFAKGTEMAMAAKDDLEKSLLEKFELMVRDYESQLRKMEEREKKMKDMLKQALEKHETKIVEVPVDRIVEKTIEVEKIAEAPTIVEKRVEVGKILKNSEVKYVTKGDDSRQGSSPGKVHKRWTEGVLQAQFA